MRRFWLFFLAIVLPLQMSWAAVHFCDESAHIASAVQTADVATDTAVDVSQDDPTKSGVLADACCSAAHGCHGLHSIMSPGEKPALPLPAAQPVARSPPALSERDALGRIDRPQWLVA